MVTVVFVCLGNICRSPMAEGLFQDYLQKHGQRAAVSSRATSTWEQGNPVHPGTAKVLRKHSVDYAGKVSQRITPQDIASADLVIAMDQSNYDDLIDLGVPVQKLHLYMEYAPDSDQSIPDPWYTGNFEETEMLIRKGLAFWASAIQAR